MVCSSFSDDDVRDIIRVVLSSCRLGSEQGPPGEDIVRQVQEILWFLEAEKRMAAPTRAARNPFTVSEENH